MKKLYNLLLGIFKPKYAIKYTQTKKVGEVSITIIIQADDINVLNDALSLTEDI